MEERRQKLKIRAHTKFPFSPAYLKKKAKDFWNIDAEFNETMLAGYIFVILNYFDNEKLKEMKKFLVEKRPAHLKLKYRALIEDLFDDGEIFDNFADINDLGEDSFSLYSDFPISEIIPYSKHFDAPKFDGTVQVKSFGNFD